MHPAGQISVSMKSSNAVFRLQRPNPLDYSACRRPTAVAFDAARLASFRHLLDQRVSVRRRYGLHKVRLAVQSLEKIQGIVA
jgi:hypothetical protein